MHVPIKVNVKTPINSMSRMIKYLQKTKVVLVLSMGNETYWFSFYLAGGGEGVLFFIFSFLNRFPFNIFIASIPLPLHGTRRDFCISL